MSTRKKNKVYKTFKTVNYLVSAYLEDTFTE